jgi:hypothetical protein
MMHKVNLWSVDLKMIVTSTTQATITSLKDPNDTPSRLPFTSVMKNAIDDFLDQIPSDELLGMHEPFDTYAYGLRTAVTMQHAAKLQPYLGYRPLEVVRRTIEYTTQLG